MILYKQQITVPEGIHPEKIITLSDDYFQKLPEFERHIASCLGKEYPAFFSTQRMSQHGHIISDKKIFITSISTNGFYGTEQKNNDTEEEPIFFRYDNVLGEIPVFRIDKEKNFFDVSSHFPQVNTEFIQLYEALKMYDQGGVELKYHYAVDSRFFGKEFSILGNLIKINRSNIEYQHLRTWGGDRNNHGTDRPYEYIDITPHHEIDRFIAPDRILTEVILHDSLFSINPYDEE